ncbi:MAG: WYL domain-containing protein [Pirellulaceae bacterium]
MNGRAGSTGTIQRQILLLKILSSRRLGVTVDELHRELDASLKTIRRDLNRLCEGGFPLSESTEDHGRRRWKMTGAAITGAGLTYDEAYALILLTGSLGSLESTAIGQATQSAVAKIRSGLSESSLKYCDRHARMIALMQPRIVDYTDHADVIEQLMLGHEDGKNVFIAYHSRSSTEPTSYGISPYAIRRYQNSLYVVGPSDIHAELRTFKVDRISEAEVTDVQFTIPHDFDAEAHFAQGFGIYTGDPPSEIQIRFSPDASRAVSESKWHPSQQIQLQKDGSTIATFQVANTPELRGWILSFGADAKVISPPGLASQIQASAQKIANQYAAAPKSEAKNATKP